MSFQLNPKPWRDGFRDGYTGRAAPVMDDEAPVMDDEALRSYSLGRVEGDLLRVKQQQEYETLLFSGSQVRPIPKNQRFE